MSVTHPGITNSFLEAIRMIHKSGRLSVAENGNLKGDEKTDFICVVWGCPCGRQKEGKMDRLN